MSAPRKQPQPKYVKNISSCLDRFFVRARSMEVANKALQNGFKQLPTIKGDEKGLIDFMKRLEKLEKVFFNTDVIDDDDGPSEEQQDKIDDLSNIFTNLGNDLVKNVQLGDSKISNFIRLRACVPDGTMEKYIREIDEVFEFDRKDFEKKAGDDTSEDDKYFCELINDFTNAEIDAKDFTSDNVVEGTGKGRIVNRGQGSTFRITGKGFSGNRIVARSRGVYDITSEASTVETEHIVRHSQTLGGKPKIQGLEEGSRIVTLQQLNARA